MSSLNSSNFVCRLVKLTGNDKKCVNGCLCRAVSTSTSIRVFVDKIPFLSQPTITVEREQQIAQLYTSKNIIVVLKQSLLTSKHNTLTTCLFKFGPLSQILVQHQHHFRRSSPPKLNNTLYKLKQEHDYATHKGSKLLSMTTIGTDGF